MSNHTPGSLILTPAGDIYSENMQRNIASVYDAPTATEAKANGCLFVAAPDMLDALRDALHTLQYSNCDEPEWAAESRRLIRAAIAKAEGCP